GVLLVLHINVAVLYKLGRPISIFLVTEGRPWTTWLGSVVTTRSVLLIAAQRSKLPNGFYAGKQGVSCFASLLLCAAISNYGKRDAGNLSVCDRYGPDKQRRLLYCATCKARFSERKGTPLFGARLPEKDIVSLLAHIDEGCGVRKTSRLLGVN